MHPVTLAVVLLAAVAVRLLPTTKATTSSSAPTTADTAPHTRDYFYTGGHYTNTTSGPVHRGQMYVEHLQPLHPPTPLPPIILIHGGGQTGTNFLTTPDNRPGWSSHFLARGHPVYLLDQPFRGRSPWTPLSPTDSLTTFSTTRTSQRFTAPELTALYPEAHLHTQWPGAGIRGDPTFDAYYASTVPFPYNDNPAVTQRAFRTAVADLLRNRIGPPGAFVVGHSQGAMMAWQAADACPDLVRAVVALEPSGPPWHEAVWSDAVSRDYGIADAPVVWDPPLDLTGGDVRGQFELVVVGNCTMQGGSGPPRRLKEIGRVPVLLVTAEASYHAGYDGCTVEVLRQAGVGVEWVRLGERGIGGNGHLFFMERNSEEIAGVVGEWLRARA